MVGCAMARSTRSGTLVGPGIWRKWRPLMRSTPYQMQSQIRCNHETAKPRKYLNHEDTKKKTVRRGRREAATQALIPRRIVFRGFVVSWFRDTAGGHDRSVTGK